MPHKNKAHATAVFLNIKRREGLAAAKAFGEKHRDEMSGGTGRTYRSRKARGGDIGDAEARNRGKSDAAQGGHRKARRRRRGFTLSEGVNQANKRS